MNSEFKLKTKIYAGSNSLVKLKELKGNKAFIVADKIMEDLGFLDAIISFLKDANIESSVFLDVQPDPDLNIVTNGLNKLRESNADIIIGLGGGSAIDTAKGIIYFGQKIDDIENNEFDNLKFIAIPSTSGTGSEATDFTVITCDNQKICFIDESLAPDIGILDSNCIKSVPDKICADTGIDVLVHAIEAYVSVNATDFTDALAEKAIKLIFENLESLHKDRNNEIAREKVLNASCIAGMAFNNAGLGINHSLAHGLGATFHIPHGRANALLLENIIKYNSDISSKADGYAAKKYSQIANVLGFPSRTTRQGISSLVLEISKLKKSLKIEKSIKELGIEESDFISNLDKISDFALNDRCTSSNPKTPSKEDLILILKNTYNKKHNTYL